MASFDVLPVDGNSSDSFPSGDYSLLHEVEAAPYLNGDSNHISFDFTNMQSTMNEPMIDQNAVSLQITKLISNNLSMKEALDKTNSIMKEQLDNLPGLVASKFKQQQQNLQAAEEKISSLEKENANLRSKLDFLLEEMSQNKEIKEFNAKFSPTFQTDEETGYEIINEKDHKKLEKFEEIIKQKNDELDSLKKEKEYLTETLKAYVLKVEDTENALKAQFELTTKLKNESAITEQYRERCESLQQQLNEYQVKAKVSEDYDSHQEIQNLRKILKMEQQAYQNVKDELSRVMLKFEKLQVDYDTASKLLEIGSRDEKTKIEELQATSASVEKKNLERIDYLTAQLFELQEQLHESNAVAQELKTKLSEVEKDTEIIPILQAQIEVYKKDYDIALMAKDAAHDEVERLTNELNKSDEKSEAVSMKASPSSLRRTSFQSGTKDSRQEFICPVCNAGFTSERGVQNHVSRCLDERS